MPLTHKFLYNRQTEFEYTYYTPRIMNSLGYYRLVEGKLTYVRGHGKVENHVAIELYAIVPGYHTPFCLQSHQRNQIYPNLL